MYRHSAHQTLRDLVLTINPRHAHLEALKVKDEDHYTTLTHKQLSESVQDLAVALLDIGFGPEQRIGLMAQNHPLWPLVYLSVISIGAVIVPISILWEAPELATLVRVGNVKAVFGTDLYMEKLRKLTTEIDKLSVINFNQLPALMERGAGLRRNGDRRFLEIKITPHHIGEILFVSSRMGVQLSHGALSANVNAIARALDVSNKPGKKLMLIFPYSHLYPTVFGILLPLLAGWTVITTPSGRMDHILRMIKETEPHAVILVPLLLERLYIRLKGRMKKKNLSLQDVGLGNLDWIFTAGVKCPEALIHDVERMGITVLEGYGVSEMAPFITISTPEKHRPGSVGVPLDNVELRIENPDEKGNGEIIAGGPNMMSGYLEGDADSPSNHKLGGVYVDNAGMLHTGDLGRIDDAGFLHITGRIRNIIVARGGTNIYPAQVEQTLLESPYIKEIEILPKEDPVSGEYPFARIKPDLEHIGSETLSPQALHRLMEQELQNFNGRIAGYKIPKQWELV